VYYITIELDGTPISPWDRWSTGTNTYASISGLLPNTTYTAYGSSENYGYGESDDSNVITFTTCEEIPSAPDNLTEANKGETSIDILWDPTINTSYYIIYLEDDGGIPHGDYNNVNIGNVNTAYLENLIDNTLYHFKVRAANNCDDLSGWSGIYSFTTETLGECPPIIILEPVSDETIEGFTINWVPGLPLATSYLVNVYTREDMAAFHPGYENKPV